MTETSQTSPAEAISAIGAPAPIVAVEPVAAPAAMPVAAAVQAVAEAPNPKAMAVAKTKVRGCEAAILIKNGKPFAVVGYSYKPKKGDWVNQSFSLPVDALSNLGAACTETHLLFRQSDAYKQLEAQRQVK